jgi:hypothetical protein
VLQYRSTKSSFSIYLDRPTLYSNWSSIYSSMYWLYYSLLSIYGHYYQSTSIMSRCPVPFPAYCFGFVTRQECRRFDFWSASIICLGNFTYPLLWYVPIKLIPYLGLLCPVKCLHHPVPASSASTTI